MSTPPSGSAEGGSAAWPEVDGLAEPEDGAAEAAALELDGSGEVEGGGGSGPLPGFRASFLARPAGPLTSASLRLPGYRPQQAASQTKATFYHLIAN